MKDIHYNKFIPGWEDRWVRRVILTGAFILLITTWFSEGYYHFDEHCQINEFAGLKLGLTTQSSLPWEYDCRMRPAFQPMVVYGISKIFLFAGIFDPFVVAFIIRVIAAILSFISILLIFKLYFNTFSDKKLQYLFLLLTFLLWFSIYNCVRFSSETIAGRLFIIGFSWFFIQKQRGLKAFFLTGLMMGLTFIVRYQVGFMIAGFALWLLIIEKAGLKKFSLFVLGILMIAGTGIIIDRWYYGEWVITTWNYFIQNMVLDKASTFGVTPWWDYIWQTFMNAIPPFSLVYILGVFLYLFFKIKDPITWTLVPFLLIHFLIPHKEIRFLFPIIGFLPVMITRSVEIIQNKAGTDLVKKPIVRLFIKGFWITNFIMVIILAFRPADGQIALYRKIYYGFNSPAKVYFTSENPYFRAKVDLNFYKRGNVTVQKADSVVKIIPSPDSVTLLITCKPQNFTGKGINSTLVYSSLPQWVKKFNFNHWVERTDFWYLYKLSNNR